MGRACTSEGEREREVVADEIAAFAPVPSEATVIASFDDVARNCTAESLLAKDMTRKSFDIFDIF